MGTEGRYRRTRQHEFDKPPRVVIRGNLLEYKSGKAFTLPPPPLEKRRISVFSKASRLRLFKLLATLDFARMDYAVFCTLTYPDEVLPLSYVTRTRHRYLFLRSMEAYLDAHLTGLWRTEWELRKSGQLAGTFQPHMHLLLWPWKWVPMSYYVEEWKRIIGWNGHMSIEVKRPRGRKNVGFYVAKYVGKLPESKLVYDAHLNNIDGRHWGKHRARLLPIMPEETLTNVTEEDARVLYSAFRRVFPDHTLPFGDSFTLMGDFVPLLARYLREMHLTDPGGMS